MSLAQLLLVLRARWLAVLATLALVVGATVVACLLLPKQYSASAAVVVDVKSLDPIAGMVLPGQLSPSYIATQADIIASDRVARQVVSKLKLADNSAAREQWREATRGQGAIESWLVEAIKRNLEVKPSRESNLITIEYTAVDPVFAAVIANAFAEAYVDTNLELRVEPAKQYASWFDQRTRALRDDLDAAQARLTAYQRSKGIVATDDRLDIENARLAELTSQLTVSQAQSAGSRSRQHQAGADLDTLPEVVQNSLVQSLKSDIARQESKLKEVSGQLGANHPQVQRMTAELDGLRARLTGEMQRVAGSLGTASRADQQREAEMRAAVATQKTRVLKLKEERDEVAALQREVERAQRAYEMVTQRLTQSSLESQANQTNVAILSRAVEPIEHTSPRMLPSVLLALIGGLALGVGLAIALEGFDARVRCAEQASRALGLPLLGVLPASRPARGWRRAARRAAAARLEPGEGPRPDALSAT